MNTEELELAALVAQAFELRETPYSHDAAAAIEAWWERRHIRAFERRQRSHAALIQLLRETAPSLRRGGRRAA